MDERAIRRAALMTLRRAILERFPPGREQNVWLEAVHALPAREEHTWRMTTEELIALARQHRFQPRPEATLGRVQENLRAMLDMLVLDFDCEREPISTPGLVARRLATIVADLEDTHGDKRLHQAPTLEALLAERIHRASVLQPPSAGSGGVG